MRTFAVITLIICLVRLQVNGQYVEPEQGDLYADASERYGSGSVFSKPNYGQSAFSFGGTSNYGNGYGKGQNYGGSNYGSGTGYNGGSSYGKGQSYGGSGYGGAITYGGKGQTYGNKGYGSGIAYGKGPNTYGSTSYGGSSYGAGKGAYGTSFGGSSYGAKGYSNGCACNSNYGASRYRNSGNSAEAEDVGSPHLDSHVSHEPHVISGPSHTNSHPSHAPPVKCGSNLLISCTPSTQVVPCSSYSAPAHGSSY